MLTVFIPNHTTVFTPTFDSQITLECPVWTCFLVRDDFTKPESLIETLQYLLYMTNFYPQRLTSIS